MARDLVLKRLSRLNLLGDPLVPGVPGGHHALTCLGISLQKVVTPQPVRGSLVPGVPGGRHASTCPGIRSLGGCHASVCLGICTLTQGRLDLRLQQFWVR